ncbi:MAG: hypothetical protein WCO56_29485 [Verrucomicrobiota bacterium]
MGNTNSVTVEHLGSCVIEQMKTLCAPIEACCTTTDLHPEAPGVRVEVMNVTQTPATKINPSDFETDFGSTVDALGVQPAHVAQIFGVNSRDKSGGLTIARLMGANLKKFSQTLWNLVAAQLKSANGFGTLCTIAPTAFGLNEVSLAVAGLKSASRALILDSSIMANLASWPLLADRSNVLFPGGIWEADFTASPGVLGAVCDRNALVAAVGVPARFETKSLTSSPVDLPALGMKILVTSWFVPNLRGERCSFECMIGIAPGNTDACKLILSGS